MRVLVKTTESSTLADLPFRILELFPKPDAVCRCEDTPEGVKITCTSGDTKCAAMIQACCDCMTKMMQAGCTCCVMMNNMPVCCSMA